jgi:uncharacterized protein
MKLLPILLVVVFLLRPAWGSAASFDCDKAAAVREQLICGDPVLSELDAQLAAKYKERQALLSKPGAILLRNSQRSWLSFISRVSEGVIKQKAGTGFNPVEQLQREYQNRIKQISDVGVRSGPFVFNRIDLFWAEQASDAGDDSGAWPGFSTRHVAYPQIDNVVEAFAGQWNKRQILKISEQNFCDGAGDSEAVNRVSYANKNVIGVSGYSDFYCHGTPHGNGGVSVNNLVLHPVIRPLNGDELFDMTPEWEAKFLAIFREALTAQAWSAPSVAADEAISEIITTPSRWRMTSEGIMVEFAPYEGGCYVCSPYPVVASWSRLRPLLKMNSPLP